MNAPRTRHSILIAAIVALFLPTAVAAAEPIPAGNPAAVQYTEAFPSAGGPRSAEGPRKGNGPRPAEVLGHRNAQRLESKGQAGREAASLAAETAPAQTGSTPTSGRQAQGDGAAAGSRPGSSSSGGGGGSGKGTGGASTRSGGGGSGVSEVLGQATGSSSEGGISPLLPLVILGTVLWSLTYLLRHRRSQAE